MWRRFRWALPYTVFLMVGYGLGLLVGYHAGVDGAYTPAKLARWISAAQVLPAELAMYCGRSGWVMPRRAPGCASKAASDTVTVTVEETWSR